MSGTASTSLCAGASSASARTQRYLVPLSESPALPPALRRGLDWKGELDVGWNCGRQGKKLRSPAHDCGVVAALAISAARYASRLDLRLFVSSRLKPGKSSYLWIFRQRRCTSFEHTLAALRFDPCFAHYLEIGWCHSHDTNHVETFTSSVGGTGCPLRIRCSRSSWLKVRSKSRSAYASTIYKHAADLGLTRYVSHNKIS
jgi:hypothetical protein